MILEMISQGHQHNLNSKSKKLQILVHVGKQLVLECGQNLRSTSEHGAFVPVHQRAMFSNIIGRKLFCHINSTYSYNADCILEQKVKCRLHIRPAPRNCHGEFLIDSENATRKNETA